MKLIVGLAVMLMVASAWGQESTDAPKNGGVVPKVGRSLDALRSINSAIDEVEGELKTQRGRLAQAENDTERKSIAEEIANLGGRLESLQSEFGKLAAGVERAEFDAVERPNFNIQEEIQEVLRPIFRDLNDASTGLRELDALRTRRELLRERENMANGAVERLRSLVKAAEDEVLKARLEGMLKSWEGRALQEATQAEAIQLQIEEEDSSEVSVIRSISRGMMVFCKTRGKNLLFALLTFVAVYAVLRWLYRFVQKLSPFHKKNAPLMARLVDVVYSAFALVAGMAAGFAVLYSAGDWVLLVLGLLFVVGILWASKNTLPHVYEQMKLILNLGPVREGERLVYEGLPWRVDTLGLYCDFRNPSLTGGVLRLPLRSLVDLHSRPCDAKEPWFPTELSDWVKLSDGVLGKVVVQTPEQVELVKLGGSRVFYPSATFLGLAPENLSRNFRIEVVFGVDYAHQAKSTDEIPRIFELRLIKELQAVVDDGLINLKVEFREAGASSLDYQINADFHGDRAARINVLKRLISRVCVDVCNEEGYVIPFTQVTIHQAGA